MFFFKHVQTIIPHLSSVPKALAANPWLKDSSTDQLIMTSNIVMMKNEASCYDYLKPKFPGTWNSMIFIVMKFSLILVWQQSPGNSMPF